MKKISNEDRISFFFDDLTYMVETVNIKKNILEMVPEFNLVPLLKGLSVSSRSLSKVTKTTFIIADAFPILPQELPKVEFFYEIH
jgi:hypothetical protein